VSQPLNVGPSTSALGDPMEMWKARGRELNEIYAALSRVVRDTIGDHSEVCRYTGDPVEDIKALGAEVARLRKLVEPKEWMGWAQVHSIYDEARLLRKERDEARAALAAVEGQEHEAPASTRKEQHGD
jgi:hypothetical protein